MRRHLFVAILSFGFLCLSGAVVWAAHTWYRQTVDGEGAVGDFPCTALNSSGYPHISYQDSVNGGVKHAWWNGSAWATETVEATTGINWETSLALDSSERPHISYSDTYGTPRKLRYARWDGSTWVKETVETSTIPYRFHSLALDSMDRPCLAYCEEAADDLRYGVRSGAGWSVQTVDGATTAAGYYCSLALDSGGLARIAYYDSTDKVLRYARQTGGTSWDLATVVSNTGYSYCSLALDSSGNPRIAYQDGATYALRYAAWNGATWDIETVDSSAARVDRDPCLVIDGANRPHIAYVRHPDSTAYELRYAEWNGTTWDIETLDSQSGGTMGARIDGLWLSLTAAGDPHVTYSEYNTVPVWGHLLYAVTRGPLAVRWPR
jgi:hypothetical protein